MASNESKIADKFDKIIIESDDDEKNMDTNSINSADEDKLLNPPPTMEDLLLYLKKIDAQTADNNTFKAATSKRLNLIEGKSDQHEGRLLQLEKQIDEIKSNVGASHSLANEWAEQRKLRNNIHVIGVPSLDGENLTKITVDICVFLGVEASTTDILSAYRVRNAKAGMFIVKFVSFDTKANLLAAKKKKTITVGNIKSVSSPTNVTSNEVYINSHVTPFVNRLLHRGRLAVNEKKLAACWVTSNCLMVKKEAGSEPIQIRKYDEFNALLGTAIENLSEPKSTNGKRLRGNNESLSPVQDAQPKQKQRHGSRGPIPGPKSSKQQLQQRINKKK